jgi:hypothetical protein
MWFIFLVAVDGMCCHAGNIFGKKENILKKESKTFGQAFDSFC